MSVFYIPLILYPYHILWGDDVLFLCIIRCASFCYAHGSTGTTYLWMYHPNRHVVISTFSVTNVLVGSCNVFHLVMQRMRKWMSRKWFNMWYLVLLLFYLMYSLTLCIFCHCWLANWVCFLWNVVFVPGSLSNVTSWWFKGLFKLKNLSISFKFSWKP